MERRIIVEGPDGSGKTTLIKQIAERYGGRVEPIAGFKNQGYWTNYKEWLEYQLAQDNPPVPVHDRFFYSELVYGKALRNGHLELTGQMVSITKNALRAHAFLIYCWQEYATLVEYVTNSKQMEGVVQNLHKIYLGYQEIMGEESVKYYIKDHYVAYNWTYGLQRALWEKLDKYMGVKV